MNKEETTKHDSRFLTELALNAGRKRQSAQTHFIHHCHHLLPGEEISHTIPLIENFLYALALLKTKTVENINEAKALIEHLLWFQSPLEMSKGNFPVYLHEYPQCKDRFQGVHLLPIFYWIRKQFGHVLGNPLLERYDRSLITLLEYCIKMHQQKTANYVNALKIATAAIAFGTIYQNLFLQQQGEELLQKIQEEPTHTEAWDSPSTLAEICVALQMIDPNLSKAPLKGFWNKLCETWHPKMQAYIGPPVKLFQNKEEPQSSLYDLFMGFFWGTLSRRALEESPFHLYAVLIQPSEDLFPAFNPSIFKKRIGLTDWKTYIERDSVFSTIEKSEYLSLPQDKGFHFFRLCWGGAKRIHTLVCQGGNIKQVESIQTDEGIDFLFDLSEEMPGDERDKQREITFYLDTQPNTVFRVEDCPANTFRMGEKVTFVREGFSCSLLFNLEEGSGIFLGHIMPGNRPSQLAIKGSQRYEAYDWQFFLRTIERSFPCKVRASIKTQVVTNVCSR